MSSLRFFNNQAIINTCIEALNCLCNTQLLKDFLRTCSGYLIVEQIIKNQNTKSASNLLTVDCGFKQTILFASKPLLNPRFTVSRKSLIKTRSKSQRLYQVTKTKVTEAGLRTEWSMEQLYCIQKQLKSLLCRIPTDEIHKKPFRLVHRQKTD